MSNRNFWMVAAALSILLALAIGWVDYLPTNDGPQHIFAGHALHRLDQPAWGYGRYLEPSGAITDIGFELVFGTLDRVLPWRIAVRITITLFALAWAFGVVALGRTLGKERRWLGLLGFATAPQWLFYMGLFSFYLSLSLGWFILAFAFSKPAWRTRDRLLLAGALAVQAMAHVVPAFLVGLTLIVLTLFTAPAGTRAIELVRTAGMGAPAALVAILVAVRNLGGKRFTNYELMPTLLERISLLGRGFVSGPAWRAWPVVGLAILGFAGAWRLRRAGADGRERTLWVAGTTLAILALALPLHVKGWEFFSVRFIPFGMLFLGLIVPLGPVHLAAWRGILAAALVLFAVTSLGWTFRYNLRLRADHADLLDALAAPIHRTGPRLPIVLEPPPGETADEWTRTFPLVLAHWHIGPLFAVEQGGVPAHSFANMDGIYSLGWKAPPEGIAMPPEPVRGHEWQLWEPGARAQPALRARALNYFLSFGPAYEDVILYGLPDDIAVLRERGYRIDFERPTVAIARFEGCPATLELRPPPGGGFPPTSVSLVWGPATNAVFETMLPPSESDAPRALPLPNSPCGETWIRVLFDMDRDQAPSPADRSCQGANSQAVLKVRLEGKTTTIVCAASGPLKAHPSHR